MKAFFTRIIIVSLFCLASREASSQLVITDHPNALALAQQLVGTGVTITNVTFTGNPLMAGFFENQGGTKIGIQSGIVLTSGRARTVPGDPGMDGNGATPASSVLADHGWNLPGDPDLAGAIGTTNLRDACVLEFDFIPLGDSIKFNYVFSSEEYVAQYVCSFNDAFAFFISGPNIAGLKNIALVPNTTIPVSIFNVNDVPGGACPNNMAYFMDNSANTFFTHDGLTVTLTAGEKVRPCETYHLKLVISDVGDAAFDTGVFLEARSLSSNVITMSNLTQTDPSGNSYLVEGCVTGGFDIKRPRKDPTALVVNLNYAGTAINGVDYQLLPTSVIIPANDDIVHLDIIPTVDNTPEGMETIIVEALAGCATGLPSSSTTIQIRDYDALAITPPFADVCNHAPVQLAASTGYAIYQWDADPTLSSLVVNNPVATPVNEITKYYVTATQGTCNARDSVILRVKAIEFVSKTDVNCKDGLTGVLQVKGNTVWGAPFEYSLDGANWQAFGTFNSLPVGNYWAKIRDGGCVDSVNVNIIQAFPDLIVDNLTTTNASCTGGADGTIEITAGGGSNPYEFSIDGINFQNSGTFNALKGDYTLHIKDNNGCTASQTASVALTNSITLNTGVDPTICNGTSFLIPAVSNAATYQWTPDGTLDDPTSLTPTASPSATTKYYVTATLGICTKLDSVEVNIRPAPVANAGTDIEVCFGKTYSLTGSGGGTYEWTPNTYMTTAADIQNPQAKAKENIKYYLSVTDAFGCKSIEADEIFVRVTPSVKIFAGRDTIAAVGQPIQLTVVERGTAGVTDYQWSPPLFLDDATSNKPIATLDKDQRYLVTGTTPEGCEGMDDVLIKVYVGPDIYVPSGFTPDNNGLNDILKAIPVGIKEFRFFRVFNRWGKIIFATQQPSTGWDGRIGGVEQPSGTYIWMAEGVDYNGKVVSRKGTVTIVR